MSAAKILLRFVDEDEALAEVELARLQGPAAAPGVRARLQDAPAEDLHGAHLRLRARSAGPITPEPRPLWGSKPTQVCRIAQAWWLPGRGALIQPDGAVLCAPVGGIPTAPDALADAPGVVRAGEGFVFSPPADTPEIEAAGVFMPWGGGFNYGHFLLDALPSLLALEEAALTADFPPTAPPFKRWQRELTALLGAPPPLQVKAPVVRVRQAAYATSMDHFLHAPNALLGRVRERMLARTGPAPRRAARIYFSRRSHANPMRVLLNEAELERALMARGFAIVRPERLRATEQVALAREAKVVVGATGAGMANALFAPPGALVIDIQPQIFLGAWVPAFGELVGHDWWVYGAPAPSPQAEVPWVRRARRGFSFGYRLPLDEFLAFLDARMAER